MFCFYFLFILKETGNKVQIESASATETPNNTILKKKANP